MSDQNKEKQPQVQESAPKSNNGAVKASSWRRLLGKKWVFPATYMAAAAIILTLMWVYAGSDVKQLSENELGLGLETPTVTDVTHEPGTSDALPVAAAAETMQWPVQHRDEVEVVMHFFDSKASSEVRQAAMIEYGDTLTPHVGIDLAREDDEPFDVLAAMSGTVTRVEKDPLVGYLVEIAHADGTVTIYQSLADVKVTKDVTVTQGEVIAVAGRNELEKEMGTHVHFEVRQNGVPVNPESLVSAP